MFKSIRKGGRIAAVTIGIVAALTPLAAPAALADGLPTPELEKSLTVDVEGEDPYAWFTDDGNYAVIEDYDYDPDDYDNNVYYGYSRLDLKSGEVTPIDIPKSCLSDVQSTWDNKYLYWLEDGKVIVYSVEDQQRIAHPIQVKNGRIELNEDGNSLTVYCSNGKYGEVCVFNLQSNKKTFTYKFEKGDLDAILSRDGKRLCVYSNRKLKIIDIPDGSTSIKEIPGNAQCNGVTRAYRSDKLLIETTGDDDDWPLTTYFIADYDGNIDKVADGNKICIYSPWVKNYFLARIGENYDTIVIDQHSGKQIRHVIRNDGEIPFDISDISRNGDIALAGISACDLDDNSSAIRLIDTKTGQRVDCKIKSDSYCIPEFVDNDQKFIVDHSDVEDPTKMHIDVYKSNIHYSPIEKLIFFAQDNMPIVVGGGIAAALMIIGGIAVVCIRRKKHAAAQTSIAGTAPKAKKQKRRRHKKYAQQEQVAQQSSADSAFDTQWQSSGEHLADISQQPVASSAPKFCRHCGTPLVPEAKFCPKCGHPVE